MKPFLLLVTACSALVIAYFVTTVLLRPMGASAESRPPAQHAAVVPTTEPAKPPPPKLTALLPDAPGFYNLQLAAHTASGKPLTLPCRLFIPREYDKSKDPRPLLIYLHDEDQRGSDLLSLTTTGPEKKLREDQGFRDNYRALIVSPQCPKDASWDDAQIAPAVLELVDEISKSFRVDPERISLTGAGMGAAGVWRVAALQPDRFAAVASTCAKSVSLDPSTAQKVKHLFAYLIAPQNDKPTYEAYCRTVELLGKAHAELRPQLNGNNVRECTQWFYSDNGNYDWLIQHKRRTADERKQRDERDAQQLAQMLASIPKTPGEHKLKFSTWAGDKKIDMPYQLSLPLGYDTNPAPCPAFLFLAGGGEVNPDLSAINSYGPIARAREDQKFREWLPFIVISPIHDNSPERAQAVVELIDFLKKAVRIDPDRIYVSGLSLGGTSCWTVSAAGFDRFAVVAPMNGRFRCEDVAGQALKYVTTWIITGGADGDFFTGSVKMRDVLAAAGDDVHLTVIPNEGHGSWPRYYQDRRFYDWLLKHRRLTPGERQVRDRFPATAPSQVLAEPDKHPQLQRPGIEHWLEFATRLNGQPYNLRYALYLPKGYDPASATKWPLMLYLHNDDVRNTDQSLIFEWGTGVDSRRDDKSRPAFPMVALVPQLPDNRQWSEPEIMKITLSLLDEIQKHFPIDPARLYLTGQQNGGSGVWALALEAPQRFAALAPFQAGVLKPDEAAKKLKGLPIRLLAPQPDGGAVNNAKQMAEAMKKGGTEAKVDVRPDKPDGWMPYYTDPELVGWLMEQHR
jgi:predicted peptidase